MGEQETDPYHPEPPYNYECVECGHRETSDHSPGECPECGGPMRDISVGRE